MYLIKIWRLHQIGLDLLVVLSSDVEQAFEHIQHTASLACPSPPWNLWASYDLVRVKLGRGCLPINTRPTHDLHSFQPQWDSHKFLPLSQTCTDNLDTSTSQWPLKVICWEIKPESILANFFPGRARGHRPRRYQVKLERTPESSTRPQRATNAARSWKPVRSWMGSTSN